MKTKISIIILVLINFYSIAQSPSDALRFSQAFNGGTARFTSMGGAFGALGGDFSSISHNPAGLGVYRTSEFTLTPSFKSRNINSSFNGSSGEDTRNRTYFDNLGFVLSFKPNGDNQTGLINLNLAFGYNRTNDFYTSSYANGDNPTSSIMDYFAAQAQGNNYIDMSLPPINPKSNYNPYLDSNAPWEAIMAWSTYLIDTIPGNHDKYWPSLNNGDGVFQRNRVSTSGSSGEYVMSLGMNLSNKLYLGASLNASNINYKSTTTYSEDAFSTNTNLPNGDKFNYSDYNQSFETTGTGYNFKIGVIYKPVEGLRLGVALHTPTYYKLQDTYSYSMSTNFKLGSSKSSTPNSRYDYNLETPLKTIASIAYVFKDLGLLSLDYEHINYSTMRFREGGDGYSYSNENNNITNNYRNVNNIRVGGELRVKEFFLRGGYAFYPSPYKKGGLNDNANRTILSGGVGYRSGNFFVDAAYLYSMQKESYIFYDLRNTDGSLAINPVSTKMTEGKLLITLGFKF
ncbi:MAG: outer membrane protein transport protein [Bacteroidales bacterium]|nr:outer membrane protein transport protein [Bacteroidales bacterium]